MEEAQTAAVKEQETDSPVSQQGQAKQWSCKGPPMPIPGPDDDLSPPTGAGEQLVRYMQGDVRPAHPSVLHSNSKYLNNPYYREAYATQALRRYGRDLPVTYMVPIMQRALNETTDMKRVLQLFEEEKVKNPEFAEFLVARRYTVYTKENTEGYEPGTLGRAIHDFLCIPGMDIEFANRDKGDPKADSDIEYFMRRRGALHDIEHIVTGFEGSSTAGEQGLGMVHVTVESRYFTPELAQFISAPNVWITTTSYNRIALHYHHVLPTILESMQQGIAVGMAIEKPLFMYEWEDYLDWQLDDIAKELGFMRGPGKEWDWTTEAARD